MIANGRTEPEPIASEERAKAVNGVLQRVLGSKQFEGAERLQGLLAFVVEEKLAGREDAIRGKTIALDFYGYDPGDIEKRENAIRVDMGRVRKRLAEYFLENGTGEPILITIPKGRYVPAFETSSNVSAPLADHSSKSDRPLRGAYRPIYAGMAVVLLLVAGFFAGRFHATTNGAGADGSFDEVRRSATFEVSPRRLQAINLAEEGRDLIFPAVDPRRLNAAEFVFKSASEMDPAYAGAHAGLAQVLGIKALLVRDPEISAQLRKQAQNTSAKALDLDPSSPWTHSASAWVAFVARDFTRAQEISSRAVELDRNDPHILEFDALISLYSGNFDRVLEETNRMIAQLGREADFVFRNARGSALFHTGEFAAALDAFEETVAQGGPVGPVAVAYMMASAHRLGRNAKASQLAEQYAKHWPTQRVDLLFEELFANPEHGRELSAGMRGAGWSP